MRKLLIVNGLMLFLVAPALAGETWTIQPRYHDFNPGDNFFDAGTCQNPYELKDSQGQTRATIQPRYNDFTSNDGMSDAGSYENPYEIKWE